MDHEDNILSKVILPFLPSHEAIQTAVVLILLYGGTTWTLTLRIEKKLDGELYKNATSHIEHILEAAFHKAAGVRPPTSNL